MLLLYGAHVGTVLNVPGSVSGCLLSKNKITIILLYFGFNNTFDFQQYSLLYAQYLHILSETNES